MGFDDVDRAYGRRPPPEPAQGTAKLCQFCESTGWVSFTDWQDNVIWRVCPACLNRFNTPFPG